MCGIAFIIAKKDVQSILQAFKENIFRRGPDASTVEIVQVRSIGVKVLAGAF